MAIQELRRDAMDVPMSSDDLMRVIAMENFHCEILVKSCTFSYVSEEEESAARLRLLDLGLNGTDLETALTSMPLPLHLCSIVFQARDDDVGFEAAAIVALKHAGRWGHKVTFTAKEVIAAVSKKVPWVNS